MSSSSGYNGEAFSACQGNMQSLILPFTKMQALGNDFIVLSADEIVDAGGEDLLSNWQKLACGLAKNLCDRRLGIGADGLMLVCDQQSEKTKIAHLIKDYPQVSNARFSWSILNSDGSWLKACGNAIRCLALWLVNRRLVVKEFLIATEAGLIPIAFADQDHIETEMGEPRLATKQIPLSLDKEQYIQEPLRLHFGGSEQILSATCIGMGNPHCVLFRMPGQSNKHWDLTEYGTEQLAEMARTLQKHQLFPDSVNVEFANVLADDRVQVYVYERGAGATLACASGACAVVVAGVLEERLKRKATVIFPGGKMNVDWSESDNSVRISGPARDVYSGRLTLDRSSLELSSKALAEVPN